MPRALLSVSDKRGLVEFARGLADLGWDLLSTGGTARAIREAGLAVTDVSEITKHPEILGGRVKTLHPAVHSGILARRDVPADAVTLAEHGYAAIDLVAVNLYPFHEAVESGATLADAMEEVDIGGPTMLRAAAKNHGAVITIVDPADYDRVVTALRQGDAGLDLKRELARKVFDHTAGYDRAIANYFDAQSATDGFPATLSLDLRMAQPLRYGENPDQPAAFYGAPTLARGNAAAARQGAVLQQHSRRGSSGHGGVGMERCR
jgi:phosphoribosylaminoimidazolecarboxamide formyltransferase / IMP cyclohydrolase